MDKRRYTKAKHEKIEVKISSCNYSDVMLGKKMFIIEPCNQEFKIGDILILREWTGKFYTGWRLTRKISYILNVHPGIKRGYVVLGINEIEEKEK